jgi:hypothetical protein
MPGIQVPIFDARPISRHIGRVSFVMVMTERDRGM